MEVKQYNRQWILRWPAAAQPPSRTSEMSEPPGEPCACCDRDGMWIKVPDMSPMPEPRLVYRCRRCGEVTAHAALVAARRSLAD
jgi:hypothetical protein